MHSFEETAAQIGCGIGDLKRAMDELRSCGPWLVGFRGIALADCERLIADLRQGKRGPVPTVTPRPGFGDVVEYSEAERAAGCGGIAFGEAIDRLRVTVRKVECLNAEGRKCALEKLRYLRDDHPPAGLNAVQIADWRQSRASARFNAEVAKLGRVEKAPARRRQPPDVLSSVAVPSSRIQRAP